jgi:hypothetical protein
MVERLVPTASSLVKKAALLIGLFAAATLTAMAQDPEPKTPAESRCSVSLSRSGDMKDIVGNALLRGLKRPEADVSAFLADAERKYATGQDLLRAAARHFGIEEAKMAAEVERFRHCNCTHGAVGDGRLVATGDGRTEDRPNAGVAVVSSFARDVTLHVVLHELGHALIREFDLPVLANEETMADAFATHYLTTHLPDRAVDILRARTMSLMIEAREVKRAEWPVTGEHDSDARRAFQIAALAIAADPTKFASVAKVVEMSDRDLQKAKDYGAEIHRSWRRILTPLWMPNGMRSKEARVVWDSEFSSVGLKAELESIVTRFDWHSQVTVRFASGDGRAGWNRSARTITVYSEYIRRFIAQGKIAKF